MPPKVWYKMSFTLDIKLPKVLRKKNTTPINANKNKWNFLELFESTMKRDLRTNNPWFDSATWDELQIKIRARKKHVRFNLEPTIHIIPRLTEVEKQQEQEERWEICLSSLNTRS